MLISTQSQIGVSIIILLGVACIWAFSPPVFVTALFMIVCITWSAWAIISAFRGTDELNAASLKYALALASGIGVPLTLACVMLMIATPVIQHGITTLAASSGSGLSPATTGFGLGVTFSVLVSCAVFIISHCAWWASKR